MVQAESVWKGAEAGWIVDGEQHVDVASEGEGMRAAIDPDACALTLPRLPSTLRDLAEPSGSLGGHGRFAASTHGPVMRHRVTGP